MSLFNPWSSQSQGIAPRKIPVGTFSGKAAKLQLLPRPDARAFRFTGLRALPIGVLPVPAPTPLH